MLKTLIKTILGLRPKSSGNIWEGSYPSWTEAITKCGSYKSNEIIEKVSKSVQQVLNGKAIYERDSVLFYEKDFNWPIATIMLSEGLRKNNHLSVVDFGGSLGSTYLQHKSILENLNISWIVVEQEEFVKEGIRLFGNINQIDFLVDIHQIKKSPDVLLVSSVLQYLEDPFSTIQHLINLNAETIILDRLSLITKTRTRLTVQHVPEEIYKASYPSWFFELDEILSPFLKHYNLEAKFDPFPGYIIDLQDDTGYYKGFHLKKK